MIIFLLNSSPLGEYLKKHIVAVAVENLQPYGWILPKVLHTSMQILFNECNMSLSDNILGVKYTSTLKIYKFKNESRDW